MVRKWASLLLVAGLCAGCFVFDELDNGMKELERFDNKAEKAEAPPPSAQAKSAKATPPKESWWQKARTLGSEPKNENIVRCELAGEIQFMSREDCLGRGGRAS